MVPLYATSGTQVKLETNNYPCSLAFFMYLYILKEVAFIHCVTDFFV